MVDKGTRIVSPTRIIKEFDDSIGKKPIEYCLNEPLADQHLRIRKGQFNIILGHPSVGKTTWIVWYLFELTQKHGLKVMMYSGENDVLEIYTQLVELMSGKPYWDVTKEEHDLCAEFIHEHFLFIDDKEIYTAEELFERFDDSNGCDICVIDPHNSVKVPNGRNWYEYSVELGMQIRAFVKRTNKTVFLAAHPDSEAQRRVHSDGDYKGMITPPIGPNMEGGSTWKNKCDNFWILHRYTGHETHWKITLVTVEKIRYQNTGVRPTMLESPMRFRRSPNGIFRLGEETFEEKIDNAPF